jgi:hypothetical protein
MSPASTLALISICCSGLKCRFFHKAIVVLPKQSQMYWS